MTPLLHSKRGFSAQSRIMVCGGSVEMSIGQPNSSNPASELGTAVHEMSEVAYKFGLSCRDFIGCTFNKIVMTEEDAEAGDVYVNYIRQLKVQYPNMTFYVEQKVCLSSISDELWGTSDLIGIDLSLGLLICLDYKNGYGLVEVNSPQVITGYGELIGNAQGVGYSLAAMDTFQLWGKINKVITGIVQPNNTDHVDGIIRLREFNMDELTLWHHGYRASHGRTDLVAGEHCKYCRASGFCGARIRRTFDLLSLTDNVQRLDENQIIEIFKEIPTIKRTLDAIKEQAVLLAKKGKPLTDYKLVRSIVHGYCTDEEKFVNDAIHERFSDQGGVTEQEVNEFKASLYNKPKLKGMTTLKTKVKVDKNVVNRYFDKPEAGTELVPITHKGTAIAPDQRVSAIGKFSAV